MKEKDVRRWSVEKRMEFIDFRLFWENTIRRSDITEQFGVSVPQASKDLGDYQAVVPQNIEYNVRERRYKATEKFKPAFVAVQPDGYFWQLRDDVRPFVSDKGWLSHEPSHDVVRLPRRHVDAQVLREVVAALNRAATINVLYQSMTENEPLWRPISPHSFAFDGFRWHVRAFCHKKKQFKDFLVSRILSTEESDVEYVSSEKDKVWNEIFVLKLKPHPKLNYSQSIAVAQDYNMTEMKLEIKLRLALLYYYLRRLGLEDCDGDQKYEREQHLVVSNKEETLAAYKRTQLALPT